jgi:predicted Holliday junction resolvase-like endonuclease
MEFIFVALIVVLIVLIVAVIVLFRNKKFLEDEIDVIVQYNAIFRTDVNENLKMLQDRIEVLERDQKDKEEEREKEAILEKLFVDGISNILNYDLNPKKKGDE